MRSSFIPGATPESPDPLRRAQVFQKLRCAHVGIDRRLAGAGVVALGHLRKLVRRQLEPDRLCLVVVAEELRDLVGINIEAMSPL